MADDPTLKADRLDRLEKGVRNALRPEIVAAERHQGALCGTKIGPYELTKVVGDGGFGEVYCAKQLRPIKRFVAIKIAWPGRHTSDALKRFETESRILAMMAHPNIAMVLDAGVHDGRPFVVMEYLISGAKITDYAKERKLNISARIELVDQVCRALAHAHQKLIVHLDLKPSNVLVINVDGRPVVKVIDFGIAETIDPQTTKTLQGLDGRGTPLYMSPEQARNRPRDVRTDVYGLGALFYELLSGMPPLNLGSSDSSDHRRLIGAICKQRPARPSERLRDAIGQDPGLVTGYGEPSPARLLARVRVISTGSP